MSHGLYARYGYEIFNPHNCSFADSMCSIFDTLLALGIIITLLVIAFGYYGYKKRR